MAACAALARWGPSIPGSLRVSYLIPAESALASVVSAALADCLPGVCACPASTAPEKSSPGETRKEQHQGHGQVACTLHRRLFRHRTPSNLQKSQPASAHAALWEQPHSRNGHTSTVRTFGLSLSAPGRTNWPPCSPELCRVQLLPPTTLHPPHPLALSIAENRYLSPAKS